MSILRGLVLVLFTFHRAVGTIVLSKRLVRTYIFPRGKRRVPKAISYTQERAFVLFFYPLFFDVQKKFTFSSENSVNVFCSISIGMSKELSH